MKINNFNIHKSLFELGFSKKHGPCTCSGNCCKFGAWIDLKEKEKILHFSLLIAEVMDLSQKNNPNSWFNKKIKKDGDYSSGKCAEIKTINKKCAFQDQQGHCSIQKACLTSGIDGWALKPFYCILYPLTVENNTIKYDNVFKGKYACCQVAKKFDTPVYKGCKKELVYLIGEKGYKQIDNYYNK